MRRALECALFADAISRLRVLFCLPLRLRCLAGKGLQGLFIDGKKLPFVEARYAIKASSIARKRSGRLVVAIGVQWCCYFTPLVIILVQVCCTASTAFPPNLVSPLFLSVPSCFPGVEGRLGSVSPSNGVTGFASMHY